MLRKKCDRYTILLIVELLVILILLPGCFCRETLIDFYSGEDMQASAVQVDDHIEVYGSQMILTPGVYQVRMQTELSEGQSMTVEVKCDNTYFKSLRTNVIPVFSGNDYVEFEVYVLDEVPAAYVQCNFGNADTSALVQLSVYRTAMGNRIVLFIALLVFGILDFLIVFRKRILEGKVSKKQQVVFWTLTVGVIVAYFPYLTDYFFIGADSLFHWSRIAYLKNTLLQGAVFPVRMQSTWLYDHGYAASLFYGDLFLYIPAVLQIIGFSIMAAYKMFVFLILAAGAWIAYFSFQKCVKDEYAALFGSMIYLLIPYHMLNIYNRGALGECLSMVFLPLICCGMYLLYTEDVSCENYKKYKWYVVWGMSGVLESHLISTEMTAVFMVLFCVLGWKKTFRRQTFLQLFQATGIVLLINMWFWLPLLYMMKCDVYLLEALQQAEVQSRGVLFAGLFQWLPNMGSAQTGMWHCEPVQVGAGVYLLLLFYVLWRFRTKKGNRVCDILAVLSVLTVVMSTRYLPWNAITKVPGIGYIVSSLQFPSRWMVLATLFAAFFGSFFFLEVSRKGGMLVKTAVGIAAVVMIFSAVYYGNSIAFEKSSTYLYDDENMGTAGVGNGEYLLAGTSALDYYYHKPVAEDGLLWSRYNRNGTEIMVYLDNTTDGMRYIEMPLIGYRGYGIHTESADTELPFITEERGTHGDLRIAVPAGYKGNIQIVYDGFMIFHIAEAVSLISLTVILCIYFIRKSVKRNFKLVKYAD